MLNWKRSPQNPIIPPKKGTWYEVQTANPDLLKIDDKYFMYFRGQQGGHDRIGLGTCNVDDFDGINWEILEKSLIDVGPEGSWDESHVLDPATVLVDGVVYLYYSAVSPSCDRSICMATSTDGINFQKYEKNPVVIGGGPEIVYHNGIFYLYYWKTGRKGVGFELYLALSSDGFNFTESTLPVLPVGDDKAWDSHTVETPRIYKEQDHYFMFFCGSNINDDYPYDVGIAVSKDLLHWEKYAKNPIYSRGEEGAWDEGAIWFPTVEKINDTYYLWYEGYGGGTARFEVYGTYLKGGKSQIGLATLKGESLMSIL